MASSLSFLPIVPTDQSAITSLIDRSTTSTATESSALVVANTPSFVRISALGRFLAATAASDAPLSDTVAGKNSSVVTTAPQSSAPNADTLAAVQDTSAASVYLQSLVNDPALRAIANNLFNSAYSALLAAAHQADFTTPQSLTRANVISIDIPAPVRSVARSDAINDYNQAAREFALQLPKSAS